MTSSWGSSGLTRCAARQEDLGARRDEHLCVGLVATGLSGAVLGGGGEQHDTGAQVRGRGQQEQAEPARPPMTAARRITPRRRRRTAHGRAEIDDLFSHDTRPMGLDDGPRHRSRRGKAEVGRGPVNAATDPGHGAFFRQWLVVNGHGTVGRGGREAAVVEGAVAGRSGGRRFRTTRPRRRASWWGRGRRTGASTSRGGSVSPRWAVHSSATGSPS